MSMSRQDFEAIARLIGENRELFSSNTAHATFASRTADVLAETNGRFDRARFIESSMPRAWVGTSKSAQWERLARKTA